MDKIVDLYWKKKAQTEEAPEETEETEPMGSKQERRFRASIYLDVWVPETDNLENDREVAKKKVEALVDSIWKNEYGTTPDGIFEPYVGGVALLSSNLLKPLDQEI